MRLVKAAKASPHAKFYSLSTVCVGFLCNSLSQMGLHNFNSVQHTIQIASHIQLENRTNFLLTNTILMQFRSHQLKLNRIRIIWNFEIESRSLEFRIQKLTI